MNNQKVEQVLKEIFSRYGIEIVYENKRFRSAVLDSLDPWKEKEEKEIYKKVTETDVLWNLLSLGNVTAEAAERAVTRLVKESGITEENAEFAIRCVVAASGGNPDIVAENAKRKKEEEERRRQEEEKWKQREEEQKRREEEWKRKEEEYKRKEEEWKRKEEERKKKEEEWKRKEEQKRQEEEWKRKEEERKCKEEEWKRKEEERKRKEEEWKRKEEERKRREEEWKHKEESKRQEEERKYRDQGKTKQEDGNNNKRLNSKKVEQVLKEIFDKYGIGIVYEQYNFRNLVFDLLNEWDWDYKDERIIMERCIESNVFTELISTITITDNAAKIAVEQLAKKGHLSVEDAEFAIQCFIAACDKEREHMGELMFEIAPSRWYGLADESTFIFFIDGKEITRLKLKSKQEVSYSVLWSVGNYNIKIMVYGWKDDPDSSSAFYSIKKSVEVKRGMKTKIICNHKPISNVEVTVKYIDGK